MADIITAVSQVGFPIVITFYLLIRFEKIIDRNTEALHELKKLLYEKL